LLLVNGGSAPTVASHRQFKPHPKKDLPVGTARSILKQAGLKQSDPTMEGIVLYPAYIHAGADASRY
jgi:hypothetical protein